MLITRSLLYAFGLLAAAALLILVDRSPSDIANQVSYPTSPPGWAGAAALLILIIPAVSLPTLELVQPSWCGGIK